MPFLNQYDAIYENDDIKKRFTMAICKVAVTVQAEALGATPMPSGTTLTQQQVHDRRSRLAYDVLHGPSSHATLFAFACVAQGTLTGSSTDAQIETAVTNIWNAFAVDGAQT
jgi:hypothetical protein